MKITNNTLAILKNFATINPSICFKAGSQIRTRSSARDIYAIVDVKEVFPNDFAVFELNQFLNVAGLFEDPDLTFGEKQVTFGSGSKACTYFYSAPEVLGTAVLGVAEYEKTPRLSGEIISFTLHQSDLKEILKAASTIGAKNITFRGKAGRLELVAHDKKLSSTNEFVHDMGEADVEFESTFKIESFKLIPIDYEVTVTENIVTVFKNSGLNLTYYLAGEISR